MSYQRVLVQVIHNANTLKVLRISWPEVLVASIATTGMLSDDRHVEMMASEEYKGRPAEESRSCRPAAHGRRSTGRTIPTRCVHIITDIA